MSAPTRIAVIGTGNVGAALGEALAARGHAVVYGSRDPQTGKVRELLARTPGGRATEPASAAAEAEVVILAVPFAQAVPVTETLGDLRGKVLVDATNPIGTRVEDAASGAERVARAAPGARVVKAFNSTGAENMRAPDYDGTPIDLYLCADDAGAREAVAALGRDLGFAPVDCGGLEVAEQLEHLARLWVGLAYRQGLGRGIAFKLLRRDEADV